MCSQLLHFSLTSISTPVEPELSQKAVIPIFPELSHVLEPKLNNCSADMHKCGLAGMNPSSCKVYQESPFPNAQSSGMTAVFIPAKNALNCLFQIHFP